MTFRWLLAAALVPVSHQAFAAEREFAAPVPATPAPRPSAVALERPPEPSRSTPAIETQNYALSSDGNIITATPDSFGDPVLTVEDIRLSARRIVFDRKNLSASAQGDVTVDVPGLRMITREASYDNALRTLETGYIRLGHPPALIRAEQVKVVTTPADAGSGNDTHVAIRKTKFFFNEPDFGVISMTAKSIDFDTKTNILRAEDVTFRIGPVPVMYLPSWEQEGLDVPPLEPDLQVGSNPRYGTFVRTTTFYTGSRRWQPGLLLDGYGKAGILAGPALRYDTYKTLKNEQPSYNKMKGKLETGFISDGSERGDDQFGNPIPSSRHFVEWRHKQTIDNLVEVTSEMHWWSDPFSTRDLRRLLFNENQQPDNFVEVVAPNRDFYASAFVRYDPNGFYDITSRLPEVRFDMNPREIADTGIRQRGYVSFAYLREKVSDELATLPGTLDDELSTPRIDAYYGFTRPFSNGDLFNITPVAGVRSTTWFNAVDGDATYSRLAGQVGFDAHVLASRKWDYDNAIWQIDGLRHLMRPVVQYRYLPGATQGQNRIPLIDRWSFLTAPPPIDLSQRRDTDDWHDTQILRLGLENLFQTRDDEYGSKNLLGVDIYQDFRDTDRAGERTLSDTYLRQRITPAWWLDLEFYQRIDPYRGALHELTTLATISDGDRWNVQFGTQRVTDVIDVNQILFGWEYLLNSQYTVRMRWRVDVGSGILTEQTYILRQQLGNSWQLEYAVQQNRDAREDSGWSFGVRLRLATF